MKKNLQKLSILPLALFMFTIVVHADYCYPDGCVNLSNETGEVGANASAYSSLDSYLNYVASYYGGHGDVGKTYDSQGRILGLSCGNGASVSVTSRGCANGATDAPTCSICAAGSTMTNGYCVCQNGATNAPSCNQCASGQQMYNNICVCQNGAINIPSCNVCPSGASMQNGQCICENAATAQTNCSQCPSGQSFFQNHCYPSCTTTNVCGQTINGAIINNKCENGMSDPNASCITTFHVTADSVTPNGSVEFSWSIYNDPKKQISYRCGFVDLTTPTPRPIPGLQNLDPNTDRARITSIQSTTRFCLICQFYSLLNNNLLGNAQAHQWIRVIKIGEN